MFTSGLKPSFIFLFQLQRQPGEQRRRGEGGEPFSNAMQAV